MPTSLTFGPLYSTGCPAFQFLRASNIIIQFPLFIVDRHQTAFLPLHSTRTEKRFESAPLMIAKAIHESKVLTKEDLQQSFSWHCCRVDRLNPDGPKPGEPTWTKIFLFAGAIYCWLVPAHSSHWCLGVTNWVKWPTSVPSEQGTSERCNKR